MADRCWRVESRVVPGRGQFVQISQWPALTKPWTDSCSHVAALPAAYLLTTGRLVCVPPISERIACLHPRRPARLQSESGRDDNPECPTGLLSLVPERGLRMELQDA